MEPEWKTILRNQFGAAIEMFAQALRACPDEQWSARLWNDPQMPAEFSEFWYVAYHTLFWLDLYLSGTLEGFVPPAPFTLAELDPAGVLPDRQYTKAELLAYLEHGRQKCQAVLSTLTAERAARICKFSWVEMSFAELLIDTLRHVQEHGAQLNMLLGQTSGIASAWVSHGPDSDPLNPAFRQVSSPPVDTGGPALQRFLDSMKIGYIEWHDGIGYDLAALREMSAAERAQIEKTLIARKDQDWRDVEALAALNTPAAQAALVDCLKSANFDARLYAVKFLKELNVLDRVEDVVVETLPQTRIGEGMTYALSLAKDYPTERIKRTLLACCLDGHEEIRVHCAAMALYVYGKSSSPFDYNFQIIYDFHNPERAARQQTLAALCQMVGVDPHPLELP
ncbi:MAG TPA: DinB family protein [Anaerolineaceae bacterium]|nr:DinB family protein [Anaerolineaceae bacterium]